MQRRPTGSRKAPADPMAQGSARFVIARDGSSRRGRLCRGPPPLADRTLSRHFWHRGCRRCRYGVTGMAAPDVADLRRYRRRRHRALAYLAYAFVASPTVYLTFACGSALSLMHDVCASGLVHRRSRATKRGQTGSGLPASPIPRQELVQHHASASQVITDMPPRDVDTVN